MENAVNLIFGSDEMAKLEKTEKQLNKDEVKEDLVSFPQEITDMFNKHLGACDDNDYKQFNWYCK